MSKLQRREATSRGLKQPIDVIGYSGVKVTEKRNPHQGIETPQPNRWHSICCVTEKRNPIRGLKLVIVQRVHLVVLRSREGKPCWGLKPRHLTGLLQALIVTEKGNPIGD